MFNLLSVYDSAASTPEEDPFTQVNDVIAGWLNTGYDSSIVWVLSALLLGVGLYYSIRTNFMQIRLFPHMVKVIFKSRKGAKGGISSFQAFTIGIAERVGTGSIAGIALAVVAGGPGSVFWMWVVATLGMATAFIESTLAQLFKVRNGDGTFRGGPSYYIMRGLGSRRWGMIFSVLLIFTYGCTFEMVQANSMAQLAHVSFGIPTWVSALILVVMILPLLVGGIRRIARFSEWLAPLMAVIYICMGLLVLVINFREIPYVFEQIFASAFGQGDYVPPAVAGAGGAFIAALTQGVKRGLYTNEAGMGAVPNAAATATVEHPVTQGMIQSLAVFVDTVMICTTTAFIILLSTPFWDPARGSDVNGTALTNDSLVSTLGYDNPAIKTVIAVVIMVMMIAFGYSTILGNYTYAESNWGFLVGRSKSTVPVRLLAIISSALGAVLPLAAAWALSDWVFSVMAVVNLAALVLLGKWAVGALRDYEAQRREGKTPVFCSRNNSYLPGVLPTEVWEVPGGHDPSWVTADEPPVGSVSPGSAS
ncbi:Na+/alanine symporter [Mobiluncus mulieris]|uniref:alanine/glycine:cation symporter family protein n=1 Tax=Mobiluncus mulieris TaxID=2052 RepID=UPI00019F9179|nr:alanine/glycine:cation symporter family protein [Mobiluncus mulieris]EEJ53568.1 amino acid carrier protein [Mobiluncus mulieris ATCC 35243]SPX70871.1 Na+/alanine symporter [Mobiluncus mulieris]